MNGVVRMANASTRKSDKRPFIGHLSFVVRSAELSNDDAAERRQCLLTLLVRQPAPKLLEHQRDRRARGGITVGAARDMSLLLESRIGEFASTATTRVSRKGRLWAGSPNCVRAKQWGHSFYRFYAEFRSLAMTPS